MIIQSIMEMSGIVKKYRGNVYDHTKYNENVQDHKKYKGNVQDHKKIKGKCSGS